MEDVYADTSVEAIVIYFLKVLWNVREVVLVGFDDDLSKKSIPIVAAATVIDLKMVLLSLILTIPHYYMEVLILCYQQHRPVNLMEPSMMWIIVMFGNSISMLITESFLWILTDP